MKKLITLTSVLIALTVLSAGNISAQQTKTPPEPSNLTGGVVNGAVVLQWQDNSTGPIKKDEGFVILRGTLPPDGSPIVFSVVAIVPRGTATFVDYNANHGLDFNVYEVYAFNKFGRSDYANPAQVYLP